MGDAFRRVLVIGLDGATFDLIRPWTAEGLLPEFRRLIETGAARPLRSTLPPMTPPGWTSMLTGVNPGKHGLFGFLGRFPGNYETYTVDGGQRKARAVWDYMAAAERRSVVVNVPLYRSQEKVHGVFVGAFPAHYDILRLHPESLRAELAAHLGKRKFLDSNRKRGPDRPFTYARERVDDAFRVAEYCLHREPWAFAFVGFESTDAIQHRFWSVLDPTHPLHQSDRARFGNPVLQIYQDIDRRLPALLQSCGDGTLVVVASDHGAGPSRGTVFLNRHLGRGGFYSERAQRRKPRHMWTWRISNRAIRFFHWFVSKRFLRRASTHVPVVKRSLLYLRTGMWVPSAATRAFVWGGAGEIYVHRRGLYPNGSVGPAEYEATREALLRHLAGLRAPDGDPLLAGVYRREEVYHGPETETAPDVVLRHRTYEWWPHYEPPYPDDDAVFRPYYRPQSSGYHRPNGILILHGPGIRPGWSDTPADIVDVAPTILWALGHPVPEAMDGRVLQEAFAPALFEQSPIRTADIPWRRFASTPAYTPEDEAKMREQLKALGYI